MEDRIPSRKPSQLNQLWCSVEVRRWVLVTNIASKLPLELVFNSPPHLQIKARGLCCGPSLEIPLFMRWEKMCSHGTHSPSLNTCHPRFPHPNVFNLLSGSPQSSHLGPSLRWTLPLVCASLALRGGPRGCCFTCHLRAYKRDGTCRLGCPYICTWATLQGERKPEVGREVLWLGTDAELTIWGSKFEPGLPVHSEYMFMKVGWWTTFYLSLVSLRLPPTPVYHACQW